MDHGETLRWSAFGEAVACERFGMEPDRSWYHDARLGGAPIEVKSCRRRIESGRRGRWWIDRDAHEALTDEDGGYALVVYDPAPETDGGPVAGVMLIGTPAFDQLTEDLAWTSTHSHAAVDQARRVVWTRAFGDTISRRNEPRNHAETPTMNDAPKQESKNETGGIAL